MGQKCQRLRTILIIFWHTNFKAHIFFHTMQSAMLGFQLLYVFEGKHLNNHNLMRKI